MFLKKKYDCLKSHKGKQQNKNKPLTISYTSERRLIEYAFNF